MPNFASICVKIERYRLVVAGAVWNLPVKIRALKLQSLSTPINNVQSSKSGTTPLDSVPTTTTSSTTASSTRLKWTPTKTDGDQGRPEDGKHISVLKQDKSDGLGSSDNTLTPMTTSTDKNDVHTNAIDISDIENSLTDVSIALFVAIAVQSEVSCLSSLSECEQAMAIHGC